MPPLPRITARQAERAILKDGWRLARTTGGHAHYRHATKAGTVTIPQHARRTLSPGDTASIIKQAGLDVNQFRNLL